MERFVHGYNLREDMEQQHGLREAPLPSVSVSGPGESPLARLMDRDSSREGGMEQNHDQLWDQEYQRVAQWMESARREWDDANRTEEAWQKSWETDFEQTTRPYDETNDGHLDAREWWEETMDYRREKAVLARVEREEIVPPEVMQKYREQGGDMVWSVADFAADRAAAIVFEQPDFDLDRDNVREGDETATDKGKEGGQDYDAEDDDMARNDREQDQERGMEY